MIAVIDYGVGNVFSLASSLAHLGLEACVTREPSVLQAAERLILPGVGAFGDAMQKLTATGLVPVLQEQAQKKPLLGICLGMQLLFEKSHEYGEHTGLGLLPGEVCALAPDLRAAGFAYKTPHMGWNPLQLTNAQHPLLANTHEGDAMYFVHSFYAKGCEDVLLATAEYGVAVPAVVGRGMVCGCQFHPEKSGEKGLRLLRAFAAMGTQEGEAKT